MLNETSTAAARSWALAAGAAASAERPANGLSALGVAPAFINPLRLIPCGWLGGSARIFTSLANRRQNQNVVQLFPATGVKTELPRVIEEPVWRQRRRGANGQKSEFHLNGRVILSMPGKIGRIHDQTWEPQGLSDELSDAEYEAMVRLTAARRAQAIVKREGAALAMSARDLDEAAMQTDRQLLAIAIAQAIVDAYSGILEDDDERRDEA